MWNAHALGQCYVICSYAMQEKLDDHTGKVINMIWADHQESRGTAGIILMTRVIQKPANSINVRFLSFSYLYAFPSCTNSLQKLIKVQCRH